ncbi:hypothetical protein [Nonomuraea basaltis]|uniref:hypothetical protein n=1 Tax=Nonomuraea basaltis TaxID=2495887 RepID=UPI00110C5F2C|nr:hypothetical protein [Nonomuraea basaltis]TMS00434.1 hypothetical protein EJK15_01910 [Nonomuraea basaltis]
MRDPQQPPGQQPPHGYEYGHTPPYYGHESPPPKKGNLDVILLLAIGLPVLLLAAGGALFFVLADQGAVAVRDSLETTEDVPTVRLDPGTPEQTPAEPSR